MSLSDNNLWNITTGIRNTVVGNTSDILSTGNITSGYKRVENNRLNTILLVIRWSIYDPFIMFLLDIPGYGNSLPYSSGGRMLESDGMQKISQQEIRTDLGHQSLEVIL